MTDRGVKITTYDPAEDLTSEAAIATFRAEALASEDAGYIAHALGVVASWRVPELGARCRANRPLPPCTSDPSRD